MSGSHRRVGALLAAALVAVGLLSLAALRLATTGGGSAAQQRGGQVWWGPSHPPPRTLLSMVSGAAATGPRRPYQPPLAVGGSEWQSEDLHDGSSNSSSGSSSTVRSDVSSSATGNSSQRDRIRGGSKPPPPPPQPPIEKAARALPGAAAPGDIVAAVVARSGSGALGTPAAYLVAAHAAVKVWLHADDARWWAAVEQGRYKPTVLDHIVAALVAHGSRTGGQPACYLEFGAGVGHMLLPIAALAPCVVGFESDPVAVAHLAANLAWNPALAARTSVVWASWDTAGITTYDAVAHWYASPLPSANGTSASRNVALPPRPAPPIPLTAALHHVARRRGPATLPISAVYIDCSGTEASLLPAWVAAAPAAGLPTLVISLSWHLWGVDTRNAVAATLDALLAAYGTYLCDGALVVPLSAPPAHAAPRQPRQPQPQQQQQEQEGSERGAASVAWQACYLVTFTTDRLDRATAAAARAADVEARLHAGAALTAAASDDRATSGPVPIPPVLSALSTLTHGTPQRRARAGGANASVYLSAEWWEERRMTMTREAAVARERDRIWAEVAAVKEAWPPLNASHLPAARFLAGAPTPVYHEWPPGGVAFPDGTRASVYSTVIARPFWVDVTDGVWEAQTFHVLRTVLTVAGGVAAGAIYVDVGMWIAPTVLFGASYAAAVVAFEADPMALYEGAANLAANPAVARKTRLVPRCIDAAEGIAHMAGYGGSVSHIVAPPVGAHGVPDGSAGDARAVDRDAYTVECSALVPALAALGIDVGDVALLKMDIEGAEARVLPALVADGWCARRNATGTLPSLWISMHPPHWPASTVTATWAALDVLRACYAATYDGTLQVVDPTTQLAAPRAVDPATPGADSAYSEFLLTDLPLGTEMAAFHATHLPKYGVRNPYATRTWRTMTFPSSRLPAISVTAYDSPRYDSWRVLAAPGAAAHWDRLAAVITAVPHAIVLDVGAGAGVVTLFAASLGATVHAFEPDVAMAEDARANIAANDALRGPVHLSEQCIGAKDGGEAKLEGWEGHGTCSTSDGAYRRVYNAPVRVVRCTSLPAAVAASEVDPAALALIVIDTQGSEPAIVASMTSRWPRVPLLLTTHMPQWPALPTRASQAATLLDTLIAGYPGWWCAASGAALPPANRTVDIFSQPRTLLFTP